MDVIYLAYYCSNINLKVIIRAVSNRWTGLLEWTTGMDFDLFFFFFSLPRANYIH